MDRKTFFEKLMTEPRSDDPDFRAARRSDVEFARLARESDAFEGRLEAALRLPVASDLTEQVLAGVGPAPRATPRWPVALAAAATVIVAVSFAVLLPRGGEVDAGPVVAAFVEHMSHDEVAALASTDPLPADQAVALLTGVGADPTGAPGVVTYAYPCPIGGERGMHLVMTDDDATRVTLLYSPNRAVPTATDLELPDGAPTHVFNVPGGAVALIAHGEQDLHRLAESLFGEGSPRIAGSG